MRRLPVGCLLAAVLFATCRIPAQDTKFNPEWEQIPGPNCGAKSWPAPPTNCTAQQYDLWFADVDHWRMEHRIRMGYSGGEYGRPELSWTQSSWIQPQVMMEDRFLYDPQMREYTVDRFLADLKARYGGVDSVLLWHTYPNIGLDDRNQYDLLGDLPGGIEGVRKLVEEFHRRGVRVLFPIMLWDQGTHDVGEPNWTATAKAMQKVNADGVNGDTLDGVPLAYYQASIDQQHPLSFEPESGVGHDEMLGWNTMSWGYWKYDFEPKVSRYKFLEPRHMVHVCDRWQKNHTDNLQYAFFNGAGFESWENIWGIWNGLTARDAEAVRRVGAVERTFAPFLVSPQWRPFYPVEQYGVYASAWPLNGDTFFTVVNRNDYPVAGALLRLPADPSAHYFDFFNGQEFKAAAAKGGVQLSFEMEAHGYGAIVVTHQALSKAQQELLAQAHAWSRNPLAAMDHEWKGIPQKLVDIARTKPAAIAPEGMVAIPAGDFAFNVHGLPIEGGDDPGVDVQYSWEAGARRYHSHAMHMDAFFIDKSPVTNAQFKKFMDATHYRPADDHNFLKHWVNGTYEDGQADMPVVYVSLEDARAYAAWAGKRLPHEWEWQYAAQGDTGNLYPWGNVLNPAIVPAPNRTRSLTHPEAVGQHPQADSPFGVEDLVSNVWQWTDEYQDDHTRFAILRGGSYYQPQGSVWYFPQAYRLDEHGKYLLLSPGRDRAGTLGFRCVVDGR